MPLQNNLDESSEEEKVATQNVPVYDVSRESDNSDNSDDSEEAPDDDQV